MAHKPSLSEKLLDVSQSIPPIPRTGTNAELGYTYVEEQVLMRMVREQLLARGILFLTSVEEGIRTPDSFLTEVRTQHTFQDAETGQRRLVEWRGQALGTSDTAAPIAIAGAIKQALMQNLSLVTREPGTEEPPHLALPSRPEPVILGKTRHWELTLYRKLVEASRGLSEILRTGVNDAWGFTFSQRDDVVEQVARALRQEHVHVTSSITGSKNDGKITEVWMTFTFRDVRKGGELALKWYDQGTDMGDKGGYKAATGAEKTMYLKNFLIPTGDDPEKLAQAHAGAEHPQNLSLQEKKRHIESLLEGMPGTVIDRAFCEQNNLPTSKQFWKTADYDRAILLLRSMAEIQTRD